VSIKTFDYHTSAVNNMGYNNSEQIQKVHPL